MQNATIQLSANAQAILARWQTSPARILNAIAAGMDRQNELTTAHIMRGYLSFPKSGPPVPIGLRVQTNRLRASMRWSKARVEGNSVTSGIGSNVKYAGPHEFGAVIKHPARHGSVRLRTDASGNLIRQAGGRLAVFARSTHKRARVVEFMGKDYSVELPERAFTRRGIRDRMPIYARTLSRRVIGAMSGSESSE